MARGEYLGEFEQLTLLAVARLDQEAYGMTIRGAIEDRTGRQVTIGAVYATVDRLVSKGYLEASQPDPSAPGLLIAVSLAACWIPARRALGIDPATALRTE